MKPKNFCKKLILNRKTIAHLNSVEIKSVYGGKDAPPKPASVIVMTCGEPICDTVTGDPCIGC